MNQILLGAEVLAPSPIVSFPVATTMITSPLLVGCQFHTH
jgi:hypothetical protein